MRRLLRREIPGIIGLLADEHDFHAMRHFPSFPFDDHATYLTEVQDLLSARASHGMHTMLALFDPEEYTDFCAENSLDPDSPTNRTRFTAEIATTSPTIPYDGQPLADLIPDLIDETLRYTTWDYASTLLTRLAACAACGKDVGQEALARAQDLLLRILDTAEPGHSHLVCSVSTTPETLVSVLHADTDTDGITSVGDTAVLEFTTVLALGLAALPGGLIMRTTAPHTTDRVYGWRLHAGAPQPLTAAQVFDAYRSDPDTGDPLPPETDVDYCTPPDLGPDTTTPGHHY
ncbi:hypothetical protein AB0I66_42795 [Streptomyces sp. NPDC050439]|uniref:hypothetical protein n=1 Tax=unclassified Streptomyces TaxID=2593676 RepID=UPI0034395CBA